MPARKCSELQHACVNLLISVFLQVSHFVEQSNKAIMFNQVEESTFRLVLKVGHLDLGETLLSCWLRVNVGCTSSKKLRVSVSTPNT
jgi:hypothetical protein